jgi:hypothetical protein
MRHVPIGALPETCELLHATLKVKNLELADMELARQNTLDELSFIPVADQNTPGTVGYGMKTGLRNTARFIGDRKREIEGLCEHGVELGCPCSNPKKLLIIAGVGLVALVGVVWMVRR